MVAAQTKDKDAEIQILNQKPTPNPEGTVKKFDGVNAKTNTQKRIAIFIVTYNAASTLRSVLDRIPESVWDKVEEVFVFDDGSQDDTYLVGLGYKGLYGKTKLSIFRNEENLGYGGNQIRGYQYAIEKGYDIVALLHGDGQYAPEALPDLLAPLERGEADAVFGSRMLVTGDALKGGMPLYKYMGNKILTNIENAMLGMNLSEFHSGYRIYSCHALKELPFEKNTQEFHFDTQIIIQLKAAGKRIVEIPIPTYYGDEICYVDGIKYAKDVVRSVLEFKSHELGIQNHPEYELQPAYNFKHSSLSSHNQLLEMVGPEGMRILDVGCGKGEISRILLEKGHRVTSIDFTPPAEELPDFVRADLSQGIPLDENQIFDVIVLADILEHMADPQALLDGCIEHLAPGGRILASVPNAVHWSMRANMLRGKFDYTNKGLLDRGHLRFFTQESAERLFGDVGLRVSEYRSTPVPWENILPDVLGNFLRENVERTDYLFGRFAPNLFAYQHVFELQRDD